MIIFLVILHSNNKYPLFYDIFCCLILFIILFHFTTSCRMFEIYNIPSECCKFQTSLQGEEIVKSTLFRKVCYALYSGINNTLFPERGNLNYTKLRALMRQCNLFQIQEQIPFYSSDSRGVFFTVSSSCRTLLDRYCSENMQKTYLTVEYQENEQYIYLGTSQNLPEYL